MPDPLTALATNIQSARLPQTLHLHSHSQFNGGTSSPDLPEYESPPPKHSCRLAPNNSTGRALTTYTPKNVYISPKLHPKIGSPPTAPSKSQAPPGSIRPGRIRTRNCRTPRQPPRHHTSFQLSAPHTLCSTSRLDDFGHPHRTVVDPNPPKDDLVRVLPREDFPSSGGLTSHRKLTTSSAYLLKLTTSLDLATAGFTSPPLNATQAPQCLATKTLILTLSFITAPLRSVAAARPSPSMALLYTTWSPSTTDVANSASPLVKCKVPPTTNL